MTELLKSYAEKLSFAFSRAETLAPFQLSEPCTVTMKTRKGEYRKHPLIGGENFRPSSAYLGKTGKLIIVFTASETHLSSKFAFMEMPADQARRVLDGFAAQMDWMLAANFDEQVERYKVEARAEENRAYVESKINQYPESFGSW